jgi:hypothetical protein
LLAIGEHALRLEPFIERVPSSRTTLYKLARLKDNEFDRVTKDPAFGCTMTAEQVTRSLASGRSAVRSALGSIFSEMMSSSL